MCDAARTRSCPATLIWYVVCGREHPSRQAREAEPRPRHGLTVEDAAESHVAALRRAPELGFDTFITSASTPFAPEDCRALLSDAPAVVARYFPGYPEIYARLGWTMFDSIDRVYVATRASERLGFTCRTGFGEKLEELAGTR